MFKCVPTQKSKNSPGEEENEVPLGLPCGRQKNTTFCQPKQVFLGIVYFEKFTFGAVPDISLLATSV